MFSPMKFPAILLLYITLKLMILTCCSSSSFNNASSVVQLCHNYDRVALLSLKQSFTSDYQGRTSSWKNSTDCCKWLGISCHPTTHRVIKLDLSGSGMRGPTTLESNSTLFLLHHLQSIKLGGNDFSPSTVSSKFSQFSSLKHLDLSDCFLTGNVPLEIARLSQLRSLDLSFNSGLKMPDFDQIIYNMTQLRFLALSGLPLDSTFPHSITNLSSLTSLILIDCKLRGEVPSKIFNLPHLKLLDISGNPVHSSFPVSNWTSTLEHLGLSGVNFSSTLPTLPGKLPHLKTLNLLDSGLHGTIPTWVWNVSGSLALTSNRLTGNLPSFMNTSRHRNLRNIDLSYNFLNGNIPSWLFSLESLSTIALDNNYFTSFSSDFLQNSSISRNLMEIDLDSNNLSGSINLNNLFSNFPNLTDVDLSGSGLTVIMTDDGLVNSTSNLANSLEYLQLSNTSIHGDVPKWLQRLKNLQLLDLSHNYLTGNLSSLSLSYNMFFIDISYNMLRGPLPIPLSSTQFFSAASNQFTGSIDSSVCNLDILEALDLSNNLLSGEFPHCLGNISNKLMVLNLGSNNLHGTLPTDFVKCSSLQYLDLNCNLLQGFVPKSLSTCTNLQVINLKGNQFTDKFPYWLHTFITNTSTQVLDLSSNNFNGKITHLEAKDYPFPMLKIIDLSSNNFSGKIPAEYIRSFRAMKNLSKNLGEAEYMNGD